MAVHARRLPTFDELYAAIRELPEGVTGEILASGMLDTMGRPGRPHRQAWRRIFRRLEDLEPAGPGRWVVEPEAEVRLLGDRLVVPDLAGWRVEGDDDAFLSENPILRVPDWTCEVLSPATERKDRTQKLPMYARAGVRHVWLVDPDARFVEVYESRDGLPVQVAVAREAERAVLPPFDLDLDLATLWLPGASP